MKERMMVGTLVDGIGSPLSDRVRVDSARRRTSTSTSTTDMSPVLDWGGGGKIEKFMLQKKPKINSVGLQHTRV